jgi:hypothetical protein
MDARPLEVTVYVHSPAKEHYRPERLEVTERSLTRAAADLAK